MIRIYLDWKQSRMPTSASFIASNVCKVHINNLCSKKETKVNRKFDSGNRQLLMVLFSSHGSENIDIVWENVYICITTFLLDPKLGQFYNE